MFCVCVFFETKDIRIISAIKIELKSSKTNEENESVREKRRDSPKSEIVDARFTVVDQSQLKISSQTHPDASPCGLRLVGLLPCAVWTPKVQKPTIAGQVRAQSVPYPISSSAIASRTTNPSIPTSTVAGAPNLHHSAIDAASNLCRCSTSIQSRAPQQQQQQQHQHQQITTNRPSSTITSSSVISTVAQVAQTIHQLTPTVRPVSAENATNNMLIVPFAAIPNMSRPPPHIQHYPASISSTMPPPPPMPPSAMQQQQHQQHAIAPYQTASSVGANGTIAGNSAPVAVLLTPTPCNNGNMKVN